jgi:hypothetical protein
MNEDSPVLDQNFYIFVSAGAGVILAIVGLVIAYLRNRRHPK